MSLHRRHATTLPVLLLAIHLAGNPSAAQFRVESTGQAFDAAGSGNGTNNPTNSSLTNPFSASVPGGVSSSFRLNPSDTNINLPTLSAVIDSSNILTIHPTTFNPGNNRSFNLQGFAPSAQVLQPFGLTAFSPSAALPQPTFTVPPLSNTTPSLSVTNVIQDPARGAIIPRTFDLNSSSVSSALPQFSDTTNTFSNPLQTSLNGALSNLDKLIFNTTYDEAETGGISLPTPALNINPFAPRSPNAPLIPTSISHPGLIETNFGFTPASGTKTATLPTPTTTLPTPTATLPTPLVPDTHAGIDNDFRIPARGIPQPSAPTTHDRTIETQPGNTVESDIYNTSLLGDSLIHQTLQQAWATTSTGTAATEPAGDFTLPQTTAPIATRDPLHPGPPVFSEMKQSVQWIKRLRDERNKIANGGSNTPGLSDAYGRALSFVRGTEQKPLSSLVGDGIEPSGQFARKAEQYLKTGKYYRALTSYEVALVSDRDNPLLLLGQGHALIGAGEYFGAVRKIVKALQNFPEIAYFKLDLNKFITDPDLIDIRRADLETRLTQHDDYRLRFLLGYIEYYIGLPEFGVDNLKAAAKAAPQNSPIAGFPKMLKLGDTLRMQTPESSTRH